MEKESVKKFDLEAAFKALDEIEIPQTKGIKANRVDLKERFGHKPATETLVEDYYDVSSTEDLEDAKEERDGEIAKAKLARIEKIVDLNAETPEDLLPSYVGKVIMQCPQCMTLFYKNQEDIEPSDENPDVVNLNEPCQHCGNTSGYTLIGKVGAVSEDEADKYDEAPAEENELDLDFSDGTEEVDAEGTGDGAEEMSDEETKEESSDETSSDEDLDLDTSLEEVPEEEPEEEKKEESLNLSKKASENESEHKSENFTLNEEVDKDLDEKLKAHNDYIAYLQQMIKQEEEALNKAENDEIKAAIQRRLDAFNADLEAALPDAVKAETAVEEEKIEEPVKETTDKDKTEEKLENLTLTESAEPEIDSIIASWDAKESLTEEDNLDRLLDSDEFKTPVSEEEIDAARREVEKESLKEKCGKQKITEESDSEIAAIINSWEDTPEVPVEESCEGQECESKEDCDDCLKEEKEDESDDEETDSSEDSEEVCFTAEEVKEVATDVAQSLATPVEDEEEAEKQAEEISEVVDEKVDKAIEEKAEEADEDEAEEAESEETDEEDESDDKESEEADEEDDDDDDEEDEIKEPEFNEDDIDALDECSLNKHIDEYLKEVYSNVKSYKTTDCKLKEGKLIVEGKISFNSGKEKLTMFEFLPAYCEGSLFFEGYNKDFSEDKAFTLNCSINESKTLVTESFGYKYKINENLVEGLK